MSSILKSSVFIVYNVPNFCYSISLIEYISYISFSVYSIFFSEIAKKNNQPVNKTIIGIENDK